MGRKCCCTWIDCESHFVTIKELSPPGYPWNNDVIRVQFVETHEDQLTTKKFALLKSISKHLFDNIVPNPVPAVLYIHYHHFPISMLQWRERNPSNNLSTPLNLAQARDISINDLGHNRIIEYTNTVYYLHNQDLKKNKSLRAKIPVKYKKQFVQSPFTTHDEIATYTKMLLRPARVKRNISDVSCDITPDRSLIRRTSSLSLFGLDSPSDIASCNNQSNVSNCYNYIILLMMQ